MRNVEMIKRKDKMIKDKRKDVYKETITLKEPTQCIVCNAVFVNGRWTWNQIPEKTFRTVCPACRRITDKFPAGIIKINGGFCYDHRTEILNLVRNVEKLEKTERPMERIINIKEENSHVSVTTTGIHIARRIGEAIYRSYACDFSFQYGDGEKSIRVFCNR
jgi:hypothetical protein